MTAYIHDIAVGVSGRQEVRALFRPPAEDDVGGMGPMVHLTLESGRGEPVVTIVGPPEDVEAAVVALMCAWAELDRRRQAGQLAGYVERFELRWVHGPDAAGYYEQAVDRFIDSESRSYAEDGGGEG